ncbi:MAG: hypothetical protein SFY56_13525 [Bacteroidota bacterium]|nr:hypothetical protein [Bacteroidota bacterium]
MINKETSFKDFSIKQILKRFLYFFLFAGIPVFIIAIIVAKNQEDGFKEFEKNFKLVLSGTIINKIDLNNRNQAKITIKVNFSNQKYYSTKLDFLPDYCTLRNDTAYMTTSYSNCLKIGDSVFVGPKLSFIIKSGIDTIIDSNNKLYTCQR